MLVGIQNNIIHEIHITKHEIIDVIQILGPNKSTGPDKINHKMLKISPDKIAKNRHKQYHHYFDH
jgi:preprotein translocase subunit Sec63